MWLLYLCLWMTLKPGTDISANIAYVSLCKEGARCRFSEAFFKNMISSKKDWNEGLF